MIDKYTSDELVAIASGGFVGTRPNLAANELARRLRRAEDRLAAWKAEAEAVREHDTMEREPDEDIEHWFARRDIARIKIKKARAAVDAIEKGESA